MKIGGLQKFSLIDFPQKSSAIIFTQGCNFRCEYCHNPELVYYNLFKIPIPVEQIFSFLETRTKQLDAVVITGGEPTYQPDLIDFIKKIKSMKYLIKLDTNGSNPEIIKKIIDEQLIDFIAMDIKATFDKYSYVSCVPVDIEKIKTSIEIIKNSHIKFEFRTTYDRTKLLSTDIEKMKEFFTQDINYRIQHCNIIKH